MSKIKNGELDQYGAEPFEQQQFGTAGTEEVNHRSCNNVARQSKCRASKELSELLYIIQLAVFEPLCAIRCSTHSSLYSFVRYQSTASQPKK